MGKTGIQNLKFSNKNKKNETKMCRGVHYMKFNDQ
jgi:hypothetical protein